MAHTEDPLEQCRKAMSDMADAVFAKGFGLAAFGAGADDGPVGLTEVVTERIGASQDLRAPVLEPPPPPAKKRRSGGASGAFCLVLCCEGGSRWGHRQLAGREAPGLCSSSQGSGDQLPWSRFSSGRTRASRGPPGRSGRVNSGKQSRQLVLLLRYSAPVQIDGESSSMVGSWRASRRPTRSC